MKGLKNHRLRNSIFIRLVCMFLLIITPIILLGFYIYSWSVKTASNDISQTAEMQVSYYLKDLENEIERIRMLQYDALNDVYLQKLAVTWEAMDDIKRTESIMLLWNRLSSIKSSSAYINDVSAHIRPISKTISANNGASDFEEERFERLRSNYIVSGSNLIIWNGGLFLSASSVSGNKNREPLFVIEIELDLGKLKQAIGQFHTHPYSGAVLLMPREELLIVNDSVERVPEVALNLVRQSHLQKGFFTGTAELEGREYFVAGAVSERLGLQAYKYLPKKVILEPLDRFYLWAWIFGVVSVVILMIYAFSTYKFIHKPLLVLVKGFRRVEHGDLNVSIGSKQNDEFGYLYERFNYMVTNLSHLINQVYKQKIMMQRAELKQLQSQINPHFLYNSFFILNTMSLTGDTEGVERFLLQLGQYYQFVTRNASDEISLDKEVQHARIYTEIQSLRFDRRITVRFDELPAKMVHVQVPRLIIQPIIENAFEHSLEEMTEHGHITIRFVLAEQWIQIVVEDNGNSLTDQQLQQLSIQLQSSAEGAEVTGMLNIHRRIQLIFGESSGLAIARSELGGLQVRITIPEGGRLDDV
ncbi:sensor histidine kinase [Paenibacillus harenae]|uniref:Two-component system sensor histidine kinase YesM n=1 Tax=Paenibacillus harenae TaxID=306543 RepID=A0ABT9U630_PAEHA|nr:histidine kinase [Paenibacillus harenae]MDQ0113709.1 two-component system sensor histidine kinase YesM [Paenibacillus harenae]